MNRVLYLTIDLVFGGVVEPVLCLTLHFAEFIDSKFTFPMTPSKEISRGPVFKVDLIKFMSSIMPRLALFYLNIKDPGEMRVQWFYSCTSHMSRTNENWFSGNNFGFDIFEFNRNTSFLDILQIQSWIL